MNVVNSPGSISQFIQQTSTATISSALSIWISNATGSDANTGLSSTAPLKTFAAFIKRYGVSPIVSAVVTITFLDATVAEDLTFEPYLQSGGQVIIQGTLTSVASGVLTVDHQRSQASGLALEISVNANLDAYVGSALFYDSTANCYAWIGKVVTAWNGVAGHYRLCPTFRVLPSTVTILATEVAPVSADAFSVYTMTVFTGAVRFHAKGAVIFVAPNGMFAQFCDFRSSTIVDSFVGNDAHLYMFSCRFSSTVFGTYMSGNVLTYNCCSPTGAGAITFGASGPASWQWRGGLFLIAPGFGEPGFTIFSQGTLFQGVTVNLGHPGCFVFGTEVLFMDWSNAAVQVDRGASFFVNGPSNSIAGLSAVAGSYVFEVRCGVVQCLPSTWTGGVQARGADTATYDFKLNGATSGAAYDTTVAPPALTTVRNFTIANLDLATNAAGFGGGVNSGFAAASMTRIR
jgi:hypothetical protein